MKLDFFYIALIFVISLSTLAKAEDNYTLFNPTPENKLREIETERPSKSDGANTVNPGHVQVETSLVSYDKNKDCDSGSCSKSTSISFADGTNIRLGLTQNSEVQLIVSPYAKQKITVDNYSHDEAEGFGDSTVRFKYSFSGNEGEQVGLAIIPFIKMPSNQNGLGNNDVEGGVGLPFYFDLDGDWIIGGMTQVNFLKDQGSARSYRNAYYNAYANTIYLYKTLADKLVGYAEYYTYKADISNSAINARVKATADFGLIYSVSNRWQIDMGANFGLTKAADDLNIFLGSSYLF